MPRPSRPACRSRSRLLPGCVLPALLAIPAFPAPQEAPVLRHDGLHGYIGSHATSAPPEYRYGAGFHAAVWSLIEEPIGGFQIGLPSAWITPEHDDNDSEPLCPPGTIARDHWPERGPTYGSVFQTMEGGLGYWAGNRFHYGSPKFSMNSTPDCYTTEIATPGWPFFRSSEPLPDDRLGIAQLSNRLLLPPDGLPFAGRPMGAYLGYAYLALPLTDATDHPQPTGSHSWTLFLDAGNFKGPVAYYLPETWSRIARDYPFDVGRGLDSRTGSGAVAGSMEINTVPVLASTTGSGEGFSRIPQLQFPVDAQGRTHLVRDVTLFSREAIHDPILAWRAGGPMPTGVLDPATTHRPGIGTGSVTYRQGGRRIEGVNQLAKPTVFDGGVFGLQWPEGTGPGVARFPAFFAEDPEGLRVVDRADVPESSGLATSRFPAPDPTPAPYDALPLEGAWANPGPTSRVMTVDLVDGSTVHYAWYRFIDQPVFQQYGWPEAKRRRLQALVEAIHRNWPIDRSYLPPRTGGELATLDSALLVTPPPGLEAGYVPIVVRQAATSSAPASSASARERADGDLARSAAR